MLKKYLGVVWSAGFIYRMLPTTISYILLGSNLLLMFVALGHLFLFLIVAISVGEGPLVLSWLLLVLFH